MALNCPNCGAEVHFPYAALPMQVCGSCRSLLRHEGAVLEAVGRTATLPFDVSALQIGTTLMVKDDHDQPTRGELVGRVRWGWENGSWNEWLLHLPDGTTRWIAEESGLYMVMKTIAANTAQDDICRTLLERRKKALGEPFVLAGTTYYLADVKTVKCVASEGALIEPVASGYTIRSIDFRNATGSSLTYQIESGTGYFYVGYYARLNELKPQNLRDFEGWTKPDFDILASPPEVRAR